MNWADKIVPVGKIGLDVVAGNWWKAATDTALLAKKLFLDSSSSETDTDHGDGRGSSDA